MARADYFDRAVQAAFHVLNGFDQQSFLEKIDSHRVAIAFDSNAMSPQGLSAIDLSIRLIARFYPKIALIPLDTKAEELQPQLSALAKRINPKIAITTRRKDINDVIVVGKTVPSGMDKANSYFIGSDGWIAKFSRTAPVGSNRSKNPFGAGVAACLAAANIFRRIFTDAELDDALEFSVLDLDAKSKHLLNPSFSKVRLGNVYLVGAGAIGHGFLWAISRYTNASGKLTIVDHDDIDLFNIQRYVLTERRDKGFSKVKLAANYLAVHKGLHVTQIKGKWENYVSSLPDKNWKFESVVSALDTPKDRIELQAALPKWIVNGWTGDSDVGVSHHDFINHACLACLYMPSKPALNEDQLIAMALGFPPINPILMDIRTRLEQSKPLDRDFLNTVATNKNVPLEKLLPYEGKSLRTLYTKGVCSGAVMELATSSKDVARAEVPMPFQSAFAGILEAAILIAHAAGELHLPSFTRLNLMKRFSGAGVSWNESKSPRCFCNDEDYRQAYSGKYY